MKADPGSGPPAPASPTARHLPGEAGVWGFILGDMLIFGIFFLTFAVYRAENPALYAQSHHQLNQAYGLINTLFLLTSSWFVATAVHAARAEARGRAVRLFALALLCGLAFCVIKALEYGEKIGAGITLMTNEYFMFTGIHLIHVLIGMGVLTGLLIVTRKPVAGARDIAILEGGAAFWHLVDLLWIVLFALFYMIG